MSSYNGSLDIAPLVRKLTVHTVIERLKRYRPDCPEQLLMDCRLPLLLLNWGAYRNCWEVIGTGLVIKLVGQDQHVKKALTHTRIEVNAHRKLVSDPDFAQFRKYMPKIHYSDTKHGLVVMEKYKAVTKGWARKNRGLMEKLEADLLEYFEQVDLSPGAKYRNFGLDKKGRLVVIDLGCLSTRYHAF